MVVFTRTCPSKSLSKDTLKISQSQSSLRITTNNATSSSSSSSATLDFSHCLSSQATNLDVASKVYPHVAECLHSNISLSVFAYGQKASGKSHSLFGSKEKGAIHHLLHLVLPLAHERKLHVSLAHFEIYKESVLDFFATQKKFLRVTEDANTNQAYVRGLTWHALSSSSSSSTATAATTTSASASVQRAIQLLDGAGTLRKTRPQAHVVFQLEFTHEATGHVSRISFVDLCASNERSTQNFSLDEKDASLQHFASVVQQLQQQQEEDAVPFRDSILTWLFQDSLKSQSSRAMLLACLSAENRDLEHTVDTLRFAQLCQGNSSNIDLLAQLQQPSSSSSSCNTSQASVAADDEAEMAVPSVSAAVADQENRPLPPLPTNSNTTTPVRKSTTPVRQQQQQPVAVKSLDEHQREIEEYRARAVNAERDAAAMTERLREEFVVLEMHIDQITREAEEARAQAKEARGLAFQAQQALAEIEYELEQQQPQVAPSSQPHHAAQEQLEVEALAQHAAAFTIQSMWRRFERRQVQRKHADLVLHHQNEIATYVEENSMLKTYVGLFQEQEQLSANLVKQVEQWKARAEASEREVGELQQQAANVSVIDPALLQAKQDELDGLLADKAALEAELALVQDKVDAAESSERQIKAKLELMESEGTNYADMEHKRLHAQIASLELQRDVAYQQVKEAQEGVGGKLKELRREQAKREAELQAQVDEKQRNVELMAGEIKQQFRDAEEARERHAREMKEATAAAAAAAGTSAHQRRSVGESFLFHYKDSRISSSKHNNNNTLRAPRLSAIPVPHAMSSSSSALMPTNEDSALVGYGGNGGVPEDFLCVKVDVEDCDGGRVFHPCLSTVSPADPDVRTYQVKAPLFDVRSGRWCRIRIKLLNSSSFPVHEVKGIMLEHLLPRGKSILHQMEVVKTELSANGHAIQSLTIQWDRSKEANCLRQQRSDNNTNNQSGLSGHSHSMVSGSSSQQQQQQEQEEEEDAQFTTLAGEHEDCFCFNRGEESGPMVLHAKFHLAGDRTIHWKFPMRFKTPVGPRFLPGPLKGFFTRRNVHRARDENKFGYLNSSWFPIGNGDGHGGDKEQQLTATEPVSNSHRVIAFQGYLQKTQSHLHQRVQRWFVFAPPFLLCYDSAEKAVEDFSNGRALPHGANRALQLDATHGRLRVLPSKVAGVERTEFEIASEGKTWTLQAGNEEDLTRWVSALDGWLVHERELDALNNPQPPPLQFTPSFEVGGALDFVPEDDEHEYEYEQHEYDNEEEKQNLSNNSNNYGGGYEDDYSSGMATRTVISPARFY